MARYEILLAEFSLWQQSQTRPSTNMRSLTNELRELAKEIKSTPLQTRALHATALLESELDDQSRAFEALKERATLESTAGSTLELGLTRNDMAAVLLRRRPLTDENLDEAISLLDEALPLVKGRGLEHQVALPHGNRAWALLNRGRPKETLADSEKVVAYFEELLQWDRPNAFIQAAMRAQILVATDDVPGAANWVDKARQLAEDNGFNEASISPEIRRHVQWLREYQAAPLR